MNAKLTRLLLGITVASAIVACSVNLSFNYPKNGVIVSFSGAAMNQEIPLDLSTQAEVAAHRNNVKDIALEYLDATVKTVGNGNNVTVINGKMVLRPDAGPTDGSKDVTVGVLTNVSVTTGTKVHLVGSPALDALVLSTIKGSGKATAFIVGTATGPGAGTTTGNFTLDLLLHLSMVYEP